MTSARRYSATVNKQKYEPHCVIVFIQNIQTSTYKISLVLLFSVAKKNTATLNSKLKNGGRWDRCQWVTENKRQKNRWALFRRDGYTSQKIYIRRER